MKIKTVRFVLAFCAMLAAVQVFACAAITKKGTQCKRAPSPGSQYCWQHGGTTAAQRAAGIMEADVAKMRCKAITKAGTQCKRTAQSGSEYCWQHVATQSAKFSEPAAEIPRAPAITGTSIEEAVPSVSTERVQCDAITKSGKRCSRKALQGGAKCWQHAK